MSVQEIFSSEKRDKDSLFDNVKTEGVLYVPTVNTGYNIWMGGAVTYIDRDYVTHPNVTETPIYPDEQIIQNINYSKALFPC